MSRFMGAEVIEQGGTTYAEVIWADTTVERSTFFSPPESSFQFGLLAHEAGYQEKPHFHKARTREINDLQQMFVVQRGAVDVQLFTDDGRHFRDATPTAGTLYTKANETMRIDVEVSDAVAGHSGVGVVGPKT